MTSTSASTSRIEREENEEIALEAEETMSESGAVALRHSGARRLTRYSQRKRKQDAAA